MKVQGGIRKISIGFVVKESIGMQCVFLVKCWRKVWLWRSRLVLIWCVHLWREKSGQLSFDCSKKKSQTRYICSVITCHFLSSPCNSVLQICYLSYFVFCFLVALQNFCIRGSKEWCMDYFGIIDSSWIVNRWTWRYLFLFESCVFNFYGLR